MYECTYDIKGKGGLCGTWTLLMEWVEALRKGKEGRKSHALSYMQKEDHSSGE